MDPMKKNAWCQLAPLDTGAVGIGYAFPKTGGATGGTTAAMAPTRAAVKTCSVGLETSAVAMADV
jgi:hypothetical protein